MNRDPRIIPLHRGRPFIAPSELSRAVGDPDAVFRRFDGPPVHYEIPPQTFLDDLRDLWADIAAEPGSHIIIGFLGFASGCFGMVGLAWLLTGGAL